MSQYVDLDERESLTSLNFDKFPLKACWQTNELQSEALKYL